MVNQRQVQKYSNKMFWNFSNQAVDFYKSHCPAVIEILTRLHLNLQDKFVHLFVQVNYSAKCNVNRN